MKTDPLPGEPAPIDPWRDVPTNAAVRALRRDDRDTYPQALVPPVVWPQLQLADRALLGGLVTSVYAADPAAAPFAMTTRCMERLAELAEAPTTHRVAWISLRQRFSQELGLGALLAVFQALVHRQQHLAGASGGGR